MINLMLGEVIFGGVGAGLYGMVIFIILTVFICRAHGWPQSRISGQKN